MPKIAATMSSCHHSPMEHDVGHEADGGNQGDGVDDDREWRCRTSARRHATSARRGYDGTGPAQRQGGLVDRSSRTGLLAARGDAGRNRDAVRSSPCRDLLDDLFAALPDMGDPDGLPRPRRPWPDVTRQAARRAWRCCAPSAQLEVLRRRRAGRRRTRSTVASCSRRSMRSSSTRPSCARRPGIRSATCVWPAAACSRCWPASTRRGAPRCGLRGRLRGLPAYLEAAAGALTGLTGRPVSLLHAETALAQLEGSMS